MEQDREIINGFTDALGWLPGVHAIAAAIEGGLGDSEGARLQAEQELKTDAVALGTIAGVLKTSNASYFLLARKA